MPPNRQKRTYSFEEDSEDPKRPDEPSGSTNEQASAVFVVLASRHVCCASADRKRLELLCGPWRLARVLASPPEAMAREPSLLAF